MTKQNGYGKIGRLSQDGTLANGSLPTQIKNRIEGNELKQTTNTKVFMNKNVSVNLFFERIYSNIYIPKEQSAKDEKKR